MKDLKATLVRLGAQRPDLRPHIRPVLRHIEGSRTKGAAKNLDKLWEEARAEIIKGTVSILEGRNPLKDMDIVAKADGVAVRFTVHPRPDDEFGIEDRYSAYIHNVIKEGGNVFLALNSSGGALSESTRMRIEKVTPKGVADWIHAKLQDHYDSMSPKEKALYGR